MKDLANIGAERHQAGCGLTIRRAVLALLSFYVFAGLLNGVALRRELELLPYGAKRDISLLGIAPAAWLSEHTGAHRLRTWLDDRFHPAAAPAAQSSTLQKE